MIFDAANKYDWAELNILQTEAPRIFLYAVPFMLFFMFVEMFYSYRHNLGKYSKSITLGSLGVGSTYLIVTALTQFFTFYLVWLTYYHLAPISIPFTWWAAILCFVVYDFCRYWGHRIAHEQRFWWATHITHHSGEDYNLTVSFRLSWVDQLKIVFFLPVILLGFDPILFFIVHQVTTLYQFWQHTELIGKMHPIVEYIFVTPTNHRIHHGKNEAYIDRNYGSTFIIWDRMFGTYQEPGEQPIYGIKGDIKYPANPFYLVFHEWGSIFKDVWAANSWRDRWNAMFAPPGKYEPRDGVRKS